MRLLLSALLLVLALFAASIFAYYYRSQLMVWFGIAPRQRHKDVESQDRVSQLQSEIGRQNDGDQGAMVNPGQGQTDGSASKGLRSSGGSRVFSYQSSEQSTATGNSRRQGVDHFDSLAPMIVVASDDGNRGASMSYEAVQAACQNWDPKRRLGSGGAATVYRADLPRYGAVAVKRFHPEKGSGSDWTREVEALCQCRHPNILEIIGHADEGPENLIVMPLMEGGTLTEAMHKMWWATRVVVLGQVVYALSFLHGQGMVHRDVKSSNILLDASLRHARLADFGLAKHQVKRLGAQTCHGTTGIVVGSPGYMAPELMMRPATEKTDAYAAGVVFLEILTGLPAWDADENGAVLTERAIKDGLLQEQLLDPRGGWIPNEIAACSAQAIPLTLFDPSQRKTISEVEQDSDYVEHLARATTADAPRTPR